jgi:hypothetical protein
MDTEMHEELRRLVDLIHTKDSAMPHHHAALAMSIDERGNNAGGGDGDSRSPSPQGSSPLYSTAVSASHHRHHHNVGAADGGQALVLRTSPLSGGGRMSRNTADSSSPDMFVGGENGGLYGGGSDGSGETPFSANDFVETFMAGGEEETRSSAGGGLAGCSSGGGGGGSEEDEEYPDDVYTDSEDEEDYRQLQVPFLPVLRIQIHRIPVILGLLDPDPLVRGMDRKYLQKVICR